MFDMKFNWLKSVCIGPIFIMTCLVNVPPGACAMPPYVASAAVTLADEWMFFV